MNKIIFKCSYFTIRVREVAISAIVILLLFFVLKGCQEQDQEKKKTAQKKEEALHEVCGYTSRNLKDLNDLLKRGDFCLDNWFEDLDDYIIRLEDQNNLLKKKSNSKDKKVYKLQVTLLNQLKNLKENQDESTIEKLEEIVEAYQVFSKQECKRGK